MSDFFDNTETTIVPPGIFRQRLWCIAHDSSASFGRDEFCDFGLYNAGDTECEMLEIWVEVVD